jgi:dTMP kinase
LKGKFITLEGIDGSGKSTQMGLLADALRGRGLEVITTCEPGGTPLGRALRAAFLETSEQVTPMAELLAFAADRAQHVEHLIKPALKVGKVVVSDRYADATLAYQGAGRGFPEDKVSEVILLATGGLRPDLTLFFDIPVEVAIERMAGRDENHTKRNRMDDETAEFYSRVRDAYLGIAKREPERFKVIAASGTPEEIHENAVKIVSTALDV